MIDTHCHLTYDGLHERVGEVIRRAHDAGVNRMITVGTTPADARRALALAEANDDVFATIGVHPHYARDWPQRDPIDCAMRELLPHPKVVAAGEMGIDLHYGDPPIDEQQRVLEWQLETVADVDEFRGPVVIHNREATRETLHVLRATGLAGGRFVFHCFTGSADELDLVLQFGAMVSFTGIVTFNNARDLAEAAKRVPIERLMVETDSPYLTPAPHRKVRPNEPCYVPFVAKFLAAQRGMDEDEFIAQMDANATGFFGLP